MVDSIEMNKMQARMNNKKWVRLPLSLTTKLAIKNRAESIIDQSSIDSYLQCNPVEKYQQALLKTQVRCSEILDPLTCFEFSINGNALT